MDNFQTIEVRWFYQGALPDEIGKWFDTVGERLENIDTRSDVYLQSSAPDIGVKLRQGNLEVKYRQQELGQFAIDGMGNSRIEQWSKWICMDDGAGLTPTKLADKSGWLKVDKIRDRRLYRVAFWRSDLTYPNCDTNGRYRRDRTHTITSVGSKLVDGRL